MSHGMSEGLLAITVSVTVALGGCGGGDDGKSTPPGNHPSSSGGSATGSRTPTSASTAGGHGKVGASGGAGASATGGTGATSGQAPDGPITRDPNAGQPVGRVPRAGGPVADQQAIVRTVRRYLTEIARGDGIQACAQLTPLGQVRMERKVAKIAPETRGVECAGVILLYSGAYGKAIRHPRITDVRVSGNRGRATGPVKQVARMVRRGNLWLIDDYGQ